MEQEFNIETDIIDYLKPHLLETNLNHYDSTMVQRYYVDYKRITRNMTFELIEYIDVHAKLADDKGNVEYTYCNVKYRERDILISVKDLFLLFKNI